MVGQPEMQARQEMLVLLEMLDFLVEGVEGVAAVQAPARVGRAGSTERPEPVVAIQELEMQELVVSTGMPSRLEAPQPSRAARA